MTWISQNIRVWGAATLMLCVAAPAHALRDPLIEGGRLCTQEFPVQEQKNQIPTHLLAAISTIESGQYHKGLGMAVPWPWTINVEGKGYHFNSKAEAIAQTQRFLAQGRRSIDVGCMQVNLKHHPNAFRDLNQAFDPATNVAYSARFLRENYGDLGDWIKATAAYHSRTSVHGQRYLVQIEKAWNKIVAKVAAARSGVNGTVSANTRPAPSAAPTSRVASQPIRSTHNVRVIQVADAAPRGKNAEVLVVRGAPKSATVPPAAPIAPVAQANDTQAPSATPIATPTGDSIRRVALDNSSAASQPVGSDSPFVFAN